MTKRLTTYIFSMISIFSLIYFSIKYYYNGNINFDKSDTLGLSIVIFIMLATFIIGVMNNREIKMIKKQNNELIKLVEMFIEKQDESCGEILHTIQNSREVSLDIFNKLKKGD